MKVSGVVDDQPALWLCSSAGAARHGTAVGFFPVPWLLFRYLFNTGLPLGPAPIPSCGNGWLPRVGGLQAVARKRCAQGW